MNANALERLLTQTDDFAGARHVVDVEGMSSARHCHLLNGLVAAMDPGEHYLEIGTWRGRTLISAAYKNHGRLCIGCDEFLLHGRFTGWGFLARRALLANIERFRGDSAEIRMCVMSSRALFIRRLVPGPIGVYFYDGDHTRLGTMHGVLAAAPLLSRRSVLLMDDWNDAVIRQATYDALAEARLRVLWSRELSGVNQTEVGFSNGVGAFWLERPILLHSYDASPPHLGVWSLRTR